LSHCSPRSNAMMESEYRDMVSLVKVSKIIWGSSFATLPVYSLFFATLRT
jgi:hypothetical protein